MLVTIMKTSYLNSSNFSPLKTDHLHCLKLDSDKDALNKRPMGHIVHLMAVSNHKKMSKTIIN